MNDQFLDWLNQEMNQRGMGVTELGRRAGVSHAAISHIISGKNKPSSQVCTGIAKAFNIPAEEVHRRAGLLSALPEEDTTIRRISLRLRELLNDDRGQAVVPQVDVIVDALYRQVFGEKGARKPEADDPDAT